MIIKYGTGGERAIDNRPYIASDDWLIAPDECWLQQNPYQTNATVGAIINRPPASYSKRII